MAAVADTGPRVGFFPGSTIGNFEPDAAVALMARTRRMLGAGASLHRGSGSCQGRRRDALPAAYNDRQGVTAAFNLNLLERINRELDGDFDLARFAHRAVWNPLEGRVEMHLEALTTHKVRAAGITASFVAGETIHTENSYKFSPEGFADLAARAGWRVEQQWVSSGSGVRGVPPRGGRFGGSAWIVGPSTAAA